MTRIEKESFNKLIDEVTEALDEVRSIVSIDIDKFTTDRRARYSLRYSVIVIVEALADFSVTILEKDFNDTAESYREAFLKLVKHKVISSDTSNRMAKLSSLRNQTV